MSLAPHPTLPSPLGTEPAFYFRDLETRGLFYDLIVTGMFSSLEYNFLSKSLTVVKLALCAICHIPNSSKTWFPFQFPSLSPLFFPSFSFSSSFPLLPSLKF